MAAVKAETGKINVSARQEFAAVDKGFTAFRRDDVLFANIPPCMENGKMAVVPAVHGGLGFGSTELHALGSARGIDPKYICFHVASARFRADAEPNMEQFRGSLAAL